MTAHYSDKTSQVNHQRGARYLHKTIQLIHQWVPPFMMRARYLNKTTQLIHQGVCPLLMTARYLNKTSQVNHQRGARYLHKMIQLINQRVYTPLYDESSLSRQNDPAHPSRSMPLYDDSHRHPVTWGTLVEQSEVESALRKQWQDAIRRQWQEVYFQKGQKKVVVRQWKHGYSPWAQYV